MNNIFDKLKNYSDSDYYAFHMPGHKRNLDLMDGTSPYRIDITEIDGFDDLHHAEGILRDAQERAARVYHADETHFLVNGSTVGILSAILGTTEKGDSILVARNCHKSVYHAIYLNELDPVYLYPKFDTDQGLSTEIYAADVQKALEVHPKIRAVMIVSPTYDGVVSDIEKIAEIVHAKGCPLIVDEAHGAHFGFDPYFSFAVSSIPRSKSTPLTNLFSPASTSVYFPSPHAKSRIFLLSLNSFAKNSSVILFSGNILS